MRDLIEERLLEAHSFRDFCPWLAGSIDVDPSIHPSTIPSIVVEGMGEQSYSPHGGQDVSTEQERAGAKTCSSKAHSSLSTSSNQAALSTVLLIPSSLCKILIPLRVKSLSRSKSLATLTHTQTFSSLILFSLSPVNLIIQINHLSLGTLYLQRPS